VCQGGRRGPLLGENVNDTVLGGPEAKESKGKREIVLRDFRKNLKGSLGGKHAEDADSCRAVIWGHDHFRKEAGLHAGEYLKERTAAARKKKKVHEDPRKNRRRYDL